MAVGTHKGFVQIWDAAAGKKLSVLEGHTARVGERGAVWNTAAGSVSSCYFAFFFLVVVSGKMSRFGNGQVHLS